MKVTLIGFKSVDFVDRETGKNVNGVNVFISYPDAGTTGKCAEKSYISAEVFNSFGVSLELLEKYIGKDINIEYNKRGKIGNLTVT